MLCLAVLDTRTHKPRKLDHSLASPSKPPHTGRQSQPVFFAISAQGRRPGPGRRRRCGGQLVDSGEREGRELLLLLLATAPQSPNFSRVGPSHTSPARWCVSPRPPLFEYSDHQTYHHASATPRPLSTTFPLSPACLCHAAHKPEIPALHAQTDPAMGGDSASPALACAKKQVGRRPGGFPSFLRT